MADLPIKNDDAPEMYEEKSDGKDEAWMREQILKYYPKGQKPSEHNVALTCPACLGFVCLDSQRHEFYEDQFRAVFVVNCRTTDKWKRFDDISGRLVDYGRNPEIRDTKEEPLRMVECSACGLEVAVMDSEEIYHFFRAIPSPLSLKF